MAEEIVTEDDAGEISRTFADYVKRHHGRPVSEEEAHALSAVFAYGFMYGMIHEAGKLAEAGDPHAREALLKTARIDMRRRP